MKIMLPTCTDLDHEALNYHGHSDCLNPHSPSGPYQWIIYTWPCRICHDRFAWMLVAERKVDDEMGGWDWAGATAKGAVFRIPEPVE
jgi:hypothetical protein